MRDKKSFMSVSECWPSAWVTWARKAAKSLRYKGVVTCSSCGETDWNFQLSVILQKICSGWWGLTLLIIECFVWLGMLSIAEEKFKEFISERHTLFQRCFKAKNKMLKVDQKVSHFYVTVYFMILRWLWNDHWRNFHKWWNMLHDILVVFICTMASAGWNSVSGTCAGW